MQLLKYKVFKIRHFEHVKGILDGKLDLCNPSSPLSRAFFGVSSLYLGTQEVDVKKL